MPKPPRRVTDDLRRRLDEIERRLGGDDAATLGELLREVKAVRDEVRGLSKREQPRIVHNVTAAEHAMATSRGRAKDPLVKAANRAGMTLRALAERVGLPVSNLSMARRGLRPIASQKAAEIEALTGFQATPKHWPGGID